MCEYLWRLFLVQLPPVNVSQLEAKVTELQNQNEEYKLSHEEEIQRLVGECDEKSQKSVVVDYSSTVKPAGKVILLTQVEVSNTVLIFMYYRHR